MSITYAGKMLLNINGEPIEVDALSVYDDAGRCTEIKNMSTVVYEMPNGQTTMEQDLQNANDRIEELENALSDTLAREQAVLEDSYQLRQALDKAEDNRRELEIAEARASYWMAAALLDHGLPAPDVRERLLSVQEDAIDMLDHHDCRAAVPGVLQ